MAQSSETPLVSRRVGRTMVERDGCYGPLVETYGFPNRMVRLVLTTFPSRSWCCRARSETDADAAGISRIGRVVVPAYSLTQAAATRFATRISPAKRVDPSDSYMKIGEQK
jgi:hypothetical protein